MEDVVNPITGFLAIFQLADIAFDKLEAVPLAWCDLGLHFVQIALVASGKVVQPNHALTELQQGFQKIAANEARHASN